MADISEIPPRELPFYHAYEKVKQLLIEGKLDDSMKVCHEILEMPNLPGYYLLRAWILLVFSVDDWYAAEQYRLAAEAGWARACIASPLGANAKTDLTMSELRRDLDTLEEYQRDFKAEAFVESSSGGSHSDDTGSEDVESFDHKASDDVGLKEGEKLTATLHRLEAGPPAAVNQEMTLVFRRYVHATQYLVVTSLTLILVRMRRWRKDGPQCMSDLAGKWSGRFAGKHDL